MAMNDLFGTYGIEQDNPLFSMTQNYNPGAAQAQAPPPSFSGGMPSSDVYGTYGIEQNNPLFKTTQNYDEIPFSNPGLPSGGMGIGTSGIEQNYNPGTAAPPPQASGFPESKPLSYGDNLNYPTFNEGGSSTADLFNLGSTAASAGAMIPGPQQPFIAGGALALKGAGLVAGIYDKAQQRDQAKKNYEAMLMEYERRQSIEQADRAREERRLERKEGYFGADYARNLGTELAGDYQGFRQGGQ